MKIRRMLRAAVVAGALLALTCPVHDASAVADLGDHAVPRAHCGPGSLPETDLQGRVSSADIASGRAARGYRCNAVLVSHLASAAGYKVQRYADAQGHQCAYYDSTRAYIPVANGQGTFVVDMTDSAHPVVTATLTSPAMLSPHESLLVNQKRGLLAAVLGYVATNVGVVDLYDLTKDCRHPVLASSTPMGVLGHESAFAPDGLTFYADSVGLIAAVDVKDPVNPKLLTVITGTFAHGARVSDDGNLFYAADVNTVGIGEQSLQGLTTLDISQIQHRVPNPQVTVLSHLTWPLLSTPQVPEPVRIKGHAYVLEVDEFTRTSDTSQVGAARMINVDSPVRPFVVSNIRLEVDVRANRAGDLKNDPGAISTTGGYAAHYCSVPNRLDPTIAACTFIRSGLRVFNISDPLHPREVAYFNAPQAGRSDAVSSIAFSPRTHELWYSDSDSGFWAVRLTNGVWNP